MSAGRTLLDKIWDAHVVRDLGNGWALLHIDRHLIHDLSGPAAFSDLKSRGIAVHDPDLTFATPDHAVSSAPGRDGLTYPAGAGLYADLVRLTADAGVRMFDVGQRGQGIVHVMGPELGLILPGMTVVCGDSHTCTNGGMGALAFGIGTTEGSHVLATQTLRQHKPKRMRVRFEGAMPLGVTPKDLILHLIARFGTAFGTGYAIEYAGSAIRTMGVEGRLTICNLSIELGAKSGLVAPDDTTFAYLRGRSYVPQGEAFDAAVAHWRRYFSDADAVFDLEEVVDVTQVSPTVTWGTNPEQAIGIDDLVPDPASADDPAQREAWQASLDYMGLRAGQRLAGTPVDWVFIGSCANARLPDLRDAARVIRGGTVAPSVRAWVVPGSEQVKRDAEAEGLDKVFTDAGFEWREPGCSMCVAANGDKVPPGARSISTSNRNFVGRQGPGARTHLASPAMAAAAALAGAITDVRTLS